MKRCNYCGKEYTEETDKCPVDFNPLTSIPACGETKIDRQFSPVVRATIVSGVLFVLQAFHIFGVSDHAVVFGSFAGALLACLFSVGVVAFWWARRRTPWSWLRVVVVTLVSRLALAIAFALISIAIAFGAKALHQ
jgi:hypothetical protein